MSTPDLSSSPESPPTPQKIHRGIIEFSDEFEKIAAALVKARLTFGRIKKDESAQIESSKARYSYKYADIAAVIEAVSMPLAENGVICLQGATTGDNGNLVSVETMLLHESSQWARTRISMRTSGPSPQQIGSAITYARRYALQSFLGLAPEEDDDGRTASTPSRTEQPRERAARTQPPSRTTAPDPEVENKPVTPGMVNAIKNLLTKMELDETEVVMQATNGEKSALDQLVFGEGNNLLKTLQRRRSDAERAAKA
jgi:hypothetical protein